MQQNNTIHSMVEGVSNTIIIVKAIDEQTYFRRKVFSSFMIMIAWGIRRYQRCR